MVLSRRKAPVVYGVMVVVDTNLYVREEMVKCMFALQVGDRFEYLKL